MEKNRNIIVIVHEHHWVVVYLQHLIQQIIIGIYFMLDLNHVIMMHILLIVMVVYFLLNHKWKDILKVLKDHIKIFKVNSSHYYAFYGSAQTDISVHHCNILHICTFILITN